MLSLFNPRFILPALIFFGVLTLGLRVDDAWQAITSGKSMGQAARAEDSKADSPPAVATPQPQQAAKCPDACGRKIN